MFKHLTDTLAHPAAMPVIGIALLMLVVFLILSVVSPDIKSRTRQFSDNPMMNALGWLGVFLAPPGLIILMAAGWELIVLAWSFPTLETDASEIRWHSSIMLAMLAAIGAVFTLIFAFIRSFATERQTRATEESLFNDKINAAANDLHARRLVTMNPDKIENRWDYHQDDIVKRNAAIDRLEGLVRERPDTAERVARLLSIYVRELTSEHPPAKAPPGATPEKLQEWARYLTACRSDMENAVQTLGRLKGIEGVDPDKVRIDLRGANLQGFSLFEADFDNALLTGAKMQGVDLSWAEMQGAVLVGAEMQGAILSGAKMQGAILSGAKMQGAILSGAKMQGADLRGAEMQGADLREAKMQGADLREAKMQEAKLRGVEMQRAKLRGVEMQGADLSWAQMQGADLTEAEMDSATSLSAADLQGAALRKVDYSDVPISQEQVNDVLYDGSVRFSDDLDWNRERPVIEGWLEFTLQWRTWQKSIGYDPDQTTEGSA